MSAYAGDMLDHHDHGFVEKAAKSGMEEVSISKVAVERTQNTAVKEFAQMMVDDHSGANTQLTTLASTKGVTLPADKTNVEKWSTRSLRDFDQEYVDQMIKDHKDAVELFENEAKKGDDADVKAFAERTLPTLMTHLDKAKALRAQIK